jgi:hypothetical protein
MAIRIEHLNALGVSSKSVEFAAIRAHLLPGDNLPSTDQLVLDGFLLSERAAAQECSAYEHSQRNMSFHDDPPQFCISLAAARRLARGFESVAKSDARRRHGAARSPRDDLGISRFKGSSQNLADFISARKMARGRCPDWRVRLA